MDGSVFDDQNRGYQENQEEKHTEVGLEVSAKTADVEVSENSEKVDIFAAGVTALKLICGDVTAERKDQLAMLDDS